MHLITIYLTPGVEKLSEKCQNGMNCFGQLENRMIQRVQDRIKTGNSSVRHERCYIKIR